MTKFKGTSGSDRLNGGNGPDQFLLYAGQDTAHGGGGKDRLDGGNGNDKLYGDAGDDLLRGQDGRDTLIGGIDDDKLYGGDGDDKLYGDDTSYVGLKTVQSNGNGIDVSLTSNGETTTVDIDVAGFVNDEKAGKPPFNICFVVDVSSSMSESFVGSVPIADVNGDGYANTKLDATIVAIEALNKSLIDLGLAGQVRVGLVPFSSGAQLLATTTPASDVDNDGQIDLNQIIEKLRTLDATYFDAGLASAQTFFDQSPKGTNIVYFLSDGAHNGGDYRDELATLTDPKGTNAFIESIGIGSGASQPDLLALDSDGNITIATDPESLRANLGVAPVTTGDVDHIDILLNGKVIATLDDSDLVDTPFGVRYRTSIAGLKTLEGAHNALVIRTVLTSGDTVEVKQDVRGSGDGADTLYGGAGKDTLYGGGGDDTLDGGDGVDRFYGGTGDDVIRIVTGEEDKVTERYGEGIDTIYVVGHGATSTAPYEINMPAEVERLFVSTSGSFIVHGNDGDNRIVGKQADDTLEGRGGNDTLEGSGGDDLLAGGAGNDRLRGGDGIDTLDGGGGDDRIEGGSGGDSLIGGDGDDSVTAGGGGDSLFGGGGNDRMSGEAGDDRLGGDAGDDYLLGGDGNDGFSGGTGNDQLYGGNGDDGVYGGEGDDRNYGDAGDDFVSGYIGSDRLYGGSGADTLYGGDDGDTVDGGAGNDTVSGDVGDDTVIGGAGRDTLGGGSGNDVFVWTSTAESSATAPDVVSDFTVGQDLISLAAIDANTGQGGDQSFSFIGTAAFSGAGQLRYFQSGGHTFVQANTGGDTAPELVIDIIGAKTLAADDFLLS